MENFKLRLKRERGLLIAGIIIVAVALGVLWFLTFFTTVFEDGLVAFMGGYQTGLTFVLETVLIMRLVQNKKALADEAKLKTLFIERTDERTAAISRASSELCINILAFLLALASIIVGFFNITAYITLLAVILTIGVLRTIIFKYYCKKL